MVFDETKEINPENGRADFVKFTIRDSVFGDLFHERKYLKQLYQVLHPEDVTVTEEDFLTLPYGMSL